jgi:hypothetical protein
VKHIRQCSQQHTSGSLNITEDISGFTPAANQGPILGFPIVYGLEKIVPVYCGTNSRNLKEDFPKLTGIGGFREGPTPGQALSLDMNKTPLYQDTRPEMADNLNHFKVAVYCKAVRPKTSLYQGLEEPNQLRLGVLGDTILTGHNHVRLGIHQGNKTTGTVKECPVQNEVSTLFYAHYGIRRLLHSIINHLIKFPRTVAALACQLPYRVAFDNPTSEPFLLPGIFGSKIMPATGVPASWTEPALSAISIAAISPENS